MNVEQTDRRTQKTRAALHAAFIELVLDQGYDSMKISDIAARANVGRSTFYEHYRTKHALLQASLAGPFGMLAALASASPAGPALHGQLQHFRDHQQVARVLLGWPTRPLLGRALADLIVPHLDRAGATPPLIPADMAARQIADAQLALLEAWVLGRPACGVAAMAEALRRSTRAIAVALDCASPPQPPQQRQA